MWSGSDRGADLHEPLGPQDLTGRRHPAHHRTCDPAAARVLARQVEPLHRGDRSERGMVAFRGAGDAVDTELQFKDLEIIEGRLAKDQKAAAAGNKDAKVNVAVLTAYKEVLEKGMNARSVTFESKEEQQAAHDLFLLTAKPVLYVCNVDEAAAKTGNDYSRRVEEVAKAEGAEVLVIAGKTEEDIALLESYEDKQMFLDELGLEESGVNRLIKKA